MDRNPCLIGETSFLNLSIKIESSERIFELAVEANDTTEADILLDLKDLSARLVRKEKASCSLKSCYRHRLDLTELESLKAEL